MHARFDFTRDTVQFVILDMENEKGWVTFGKPHQLVYRLDHFMGCRIGLFMYSTKETGGTAKFTDFSYHVEEEQA